MRSPTDIKDGSGTRGEPAGVSTTAHPPITSYVLGQRVTFHPGRGDRWYPGIVTRLESGLRPDRSAWHTIFVSSTHDLPSGEWERSGAHPFEDRDAPRVLPAPEDGERPVNELAAVDPPGHEELGPIPVKGGSLSHGFYEALAGRAPSCEDEEYRRGYVIGQASPGEPVKYTVMVPERNGVAAAPNTALIKQLRHACAVAFGDLLAQGMPRDTSTGQLLTAAIVAADVCLVRANTEETPS